MKEKGHRGRDSFRTFERLVKLTPSLSPPAHHPPLSFLHSSPTNPILLLTYTNKGESERSQPRSTQAACDTSNRQKTHIRIDEFGVDSRTDGIDKRSDEERCLSRNDSEDQFHDESRHERSFSKVTPEYIKIYVIWRGGYETTISVVTNDIVWRGRRGEERQDSRRQCCWLSK